MIPIKRMRVFAGPNGSGKTTIFKGILKENKKVIRSTPSTLLKFGLDSTSL